MVMFYWTFSYAHDQIGVANLGKKKCEAKPNNAIQIETTIIVPYQNGVCVYTAETDQIHFNESTKTEILNGTKNKALLAKLSESFRKTL